MKKRNPFLVFLYTIISLGIYKIIYLYKTLNQFKKNNYHIINPITYLVTLIIGLVLLFFPNIINIFGIIIILLINLMVIFSIINVLHKSNFVKTKLNIFIKYILIFFATLSIIVLIWGIGLQQFDTALVKLPYSYEEIVLIFLIVLGFLSFIIGNLWLISFQQDINQLIKNNKTRLINTVINKVNQEVREEDVKKNDNKQNLDVAKEIKEKEEIKQQVQPKQDVDQDLTNQQVDIKQEQINNDKELNQEIVQEDTNNQEDDEQHVTIDTNIDNNTNVTIHLNSMEIQLPTIQVCKQKQFSPIYFIKNINLMNVEGMDKKIVIKRPEIEEYELNSMYVYIENKETTLTRVIFDPIPFVENDKLMNIENNN